MNVLAVATSRSRWLALAVPVALALLAYAPVLPSLVHEWIEFPSLSHGFVIPIIAGYLVWSRRDRFMDAPLSPSIAGLPVLVIGLLALAIGIRGEESFLARLSLPVILLGLVLFIGGREITRHTWPGILYLLFMVPPPFSTLQQLTYRSRIIDAEISAHLLEWLGVPVLRDGVFLNLPGITLEVADVCSSIPAIAALLSLGTAYAAIAGRPLGIKLILVAVTLPFAIGANIVRITSTAALVYYVGRWTLDSVYHMFNGTVNFVFTFLLLLAFDEFLNRFVVKRRR